MWHSCGLGGIYNPREAETRCCGLCAPLSQGAILPLEISGATQKKCRETGTSPSLPVTLSASGSTQFCLAGPRQNAQGEGNTEGSKKEQDKRRASQVTPARVTSPRSAGRFKGFRTLECGRMRGSHLNLGVHFWGLILRKWPPLAALSGGHRGDTAHRPSQKMCR